jgi:hypothetical protein
MISYNVSIDDCTVNFKEGKKENDWRRIELEVFPQISWENFRKIAFQKEICVQGFSRDREELPPKSTIIFLIKLKDEKKILGFLGGLFNNKPLEKEKWWISMLRLIRRK